MSQPHPNSGNQHPVHGAGMNLKKIIAVGAGSLTIFAIGIGWAYSLMSGWKAELRATTGEAPVPAQFGKAEIGIVDQVLFEKDHRLEIWKAAHAKRLGGYGWVDKTKGIAHIPIEQAMERVIASPPDIAGEGVVPAAAAPVLPPAADAPAPSAPPPRHHGGKP